MGEEVESGHEQDGVDGQHPMVLEHLLDFVEEDGGLGPSGLGGIILLLLPSTDEDFAFGKKSAQESSESRDTSSSPEKCTPCGFRHEVEVNEGGNEVTDSITLLHDTASKAASLDREVLEGGGGS